MKRLPISISLMLLLAVVVRADEKKDDAPADPLPDGSRWVGTQIHDKNHANTHDRPANFRVTRREDDKFAAEYWCEGNGLKLEGVVSKDGKIECKPVQVLKGQWQSHILDDVWTGQVKGDDLSLDRKTSQRGGGHEAVFKREEPKGRKKHK